MRWETRGVTMNGHSANHSAAYTPSCYGAERTKARGFEKN